MAVEVGLSPIYNLPFFTDVNGDPLAGGTIGTYIPGSVTTEQVTYTTSAGDVENTNPIVLDSSGRLNTTIWLEYGLPYNLVLRDSLGNVVDAVDNVRGNLLADQVLASDVGYEAGTVASALDDIVDVQLAAALNFTQTGIGAVTRPVTTKFKDFPITVKDFGALGTADVGNEPEDTAAFAIALGTGKNVFVPQGSFYSSTSIPVGYGQRLMGDGQHKTNIFYSGASSGIYLGSPDLTSLIYNCEVRDLTLHCTNRAVTVNGVELQNCVYFNVENLSIFGSGSPNDPDPADQALYGYGLYLHDNTIIGRVSHVSCRLWLYGRFYACDAGNQSRWTAAIVDGGHGELANCHRGIVVGDPTVPLYSGVGVTFRDLSLQGCYTTGINIYSGDNTIIENCYFEGNGNYDIAVGTPAGAPAPVGVKILKNSMSTENIGITPYGNFPYIAKVYVDRGSFTTIRDNNMSISTAIPLVSIAATADDTVVTGNRLNSAIAVSDRILNSSNTTLTADNFPEAPRTTSGSVTRDLSAATGNVSYTGVGFKPTSIEFFAVVEGTAESSIGSADAGAGVRSRCMTTDTAGLKYNSADAIRIIRASGGNEQKATLVSFDPDGFTLAWTKVGAPPANTLVVNYVARR